MEKVNIRKINKSLKEIKEDEMTLENKELTTKEKIIYILVIIVILTFIIIFWYLIIKLIKWIW